MLLSPAQQTRVLEIARASVRAALQREEAAVDPAVDPFLQQPAGCFVSLHGAADHRLRGCVGRVDATQPLLAALQSASAHVLQDPRFAVDPVRLDELPLLEIEVSVLSPPRPSGPFDFDLINDGIYLSFGGRSGCFLPQVARETGWTREQLLDRLCVEKLGLPRETWRHQQARLDAFSVQVIGPARF